ncbi:hypothetical protein IKF12_02060 [Candidatus Saccharibacteria bacterium]|nr:hypothetical protein [Candidatus Saccharibacteria bacterium]MBR3143966.1 hypothetical protein [Candidatus Saccharibacteria bacterium]
MEDKRKNTFILIGSLLVLFCVLIVVFLLIIFNGNETKTSEEEEDESLAALVCRSGGREDGFFHSTKANQITNEIKATFKSEAFDKLYYSYEGVYRSTETAEEDSIMHTQYNIYMGDNNMPQDSLSQSYSVTKDRYHLTLYLDDRSNFNSITAVFFYVDDKDVEKFKKFDIGEMNKYYEAKEFDCNVIE